MKSAGQIACMLPLLALGKNMLAFQSIHSGSRLIVSSVVSVSFNLPRKLGDRYSLGQIDSKIGSFGAKMPKKESGVMGNATSGSELSSMGQRLLRVAKNVQSEIESAVGDQPSQSEFIQLYREWITFERGISGSAEKRIGQWQLLLHSMITGPTIEDSIRSLLRYAKVVWGDRGPIELRDESDFAALIFSEPDWVGPEGLISAIWPLTLTLSELEFLSNATVSGVFGRVPHDDCLPDGVASLLFGAPLEYQKSEIALMIPRQFLSRAVVARAADLPEYFRANLPLTLGRRRMNLSVSKMVAGLIRDDRLRSPGKNTSRSVVAARMAMSETSLRRKLKEENTSYSEIKEKVYDDLTKELLRSDNLSIDDIADRLGYSDGFALRRSFRRRNGRSPSAYRKDRVGAAI